MRTVFANKLRTVFAKIKKVILMLEQQIGPQKQKSTNQELHVIVGISGNTGKFVSEELVRLGYKVRGISSSGKGPDNIEIIKADALNQDQLTKAVKGATTIYHCLGLPYSQWFKKHPIIMKNVIHAAAANGSETKIVFAENLYALGEKGAKLGPMSDKTPELAEDRKGLLRKELVHMLLEAQAKGLIKVAIGRASDFFGPNASNSVFNMFIIPSLIKKKPAKMFANITTKHSWIYLPDFARSLVVLGTNNQADGKMWILPHCETMTIKEFVEQCYTELNVNIPVKVSTRSMLLLKLAGLFNKEAKEYAKMNYQRKADWVVDDSLFRKTFIDWKSTDLKTAFNDTLAFYN